MKVVWIQSKQKSSIKVNIVHKRSMLFDSTSSIWNTCSCFPCQSNRWPSLSLTTQLPHKRPTLGPKTLPQLLYWIRALVTRMRDPKTTKHKMFEPFTLLVLEPLSTTFWFSIQVHLFLKNDVIKSFLCPESKKSAIQFKKHLRL